jgi:hypothetical protein
MRITLLVLLVCSLFACKEARYPRMAHAEIIADTLVVDGPCIVTNLKYIQKIQSSDSTVQNPGEPEEVYKFMHHLFTKDSINVINTTNVVIKFTDFFGEFDDQIINLENYKKGFAFYTPGTEVIVLEDWSSKEAIVHASKGNLTALKMELARMDSVKNTKFITEEQIAKELGDTKAERIRIEEEARKQLKENQPNTTLDRVDIGKK